MTHENDLVKDCKAYRDKHIDDLQVIQSNIDLELKKTKGIYQSDKEVETEAKATVQPLVNIVRKFIQKGYRINETDDIIKALGFEIPSKYSDLVEKMVRIPLNKKQIKQQETQQYPPKFVSSKPEPPRPITNTERPKLNLSYVHQVHQPESTLVFSLGGVD